MIGRVSWLGKVLKPDSETLAASINWLEKFVTPEADRAERRRVEQFAAYRWNGTSLTCDTVHDISSSGLYLLTAERWQPGTIVALTLQREGPLDPDPARRITTQTRVIRCGSDGVGLSFLWAKDDPEARQWDALIDCLIQQTRPAHMESLARLVEAFAFLGQICPDGIEEISEWVRTRASSHKILTAVAIALKAKLLLENDPYSEQLLVDPQVTLRILEVGSETHEEWLQNFWAGLLITASAANARHEGHLELVETFSQLTSIPIRILTVVCTKSTKVLLHNGQVAAKRLTCNTEELASTVGARGPQLQRDLQSLASLQLIEKSDPRASALVAATETLITATPLALKLFAFCNGHRGSVPDFYFAENTAAAAAR
ncbi:PilZ domain-containing protein [Occallatibacter savannae]|uniref:PilZ domain-containing protein n=1 Tax=Occallatibacter savannae TaxID=1002691 RepID=UPI0013A57AEF|nr:PilZ domain-containing protein [Occallatibacter savannae]